MSILNKVKRKRVDTDIERRTITGLIVSDTFYRDVRPMVRPELLQIDYSKIILGWIDEYFENYESVPGKHIQDIYVSKELTLSDELKNVTSQYLRTLSEEYEDLERFNESYLEDQARGYFKQRSLEVHAERVKAFLENGDSEAAELEVTGFKQISKSTSSWVNPLDETFIEKVFDKEDDELFRLPGALGQLFGPMKRGMLVSLLGPMKRGKTFWLGEFRQVAMDQRLRVAEISLEMQDTEIGLRAYKRITGQDEDKGGEIIFPIFDCKNNQTNECSKSCRTNWEQLLDDDDLPPAFSPDLTYKVCTACRGTQDFVPAVWYDLISRDKLGLRGAKKKIKSYSMMFGRDNWRVKTYPINTANMKDIKNDLNVLEYTEGFIPDVIIVDYADILGPEDKRLVGRDAINETWKGLKNLAQERKCLVVTATQANRDSIDRKHVSQKNTGEDIRKLAHVNIMAALNQTPLEKRKGVMRLGILVNRGRNSDEFIQAEVLQALAIGQPYLDAELILGNVEG